MGVGKFCQSIKEFAYEENFSENLDRCSRGSSGYGTVPVSRAGSSTRRHNHRQWRHKSPRVSANSQTQGISTAATKGGQHETASIPLATQSAAE